MGKNLRKKRDGFPLRNTVWVDGMVCGKRMAVRALSSQLQALLASLRRDIVTYGRAPIADMYRSTFQDCSEADSPDAWDLVFLNICRTALFDVPCNLYLVEPRQEQFQPVEKVVSRT